MINELFAKGSKAVFRIVGSGEALLYPDFSELLLYINEKKFKAVLFTNGILMEKNERIIKKTLERLVISWHGKEENPNNVNDKYEDILNEIFKKIGNESYPKSMSLMINFVITSENIDNIYKFMQKFGNKRTIVRFQHPFDYTNIEKIEIQNFENLKKTIFKIKNNFKNVKFIPELSEKNLYKYYFDKKYFTEKSRCEIIESELHIDCLGNVYICDSGILGNIKRDSIEKIISSRKRSLFIKKRQEYFKLNKKGPDFCSRCCYD